jgi:hypothetical protein
MPLQYMRLQLGNQRTESQRYTNSVLLHHYWVFGLFPSIGILTYSRSWALLEELSIVRPSRTPTAFYGTRRFNTVFKRALHWSLPWTISIQSTPSHPISLRSILHLRLGHFRNRLNFYGEELLAPRPTPKLEDHPLSAVRDCLFSISAAALQNWW